MTSKDVRKEWQKARVYGSQARKDRVARIAAQTKEAKKDSTSFADAMDEMGGGFPERDPRLDHHGTP
jgi:hypothetical protein